MQNECANNYSTLSLSVFSHFLPAIPSVSDSTQGKGARNVNSVEKNIQFITEASFTVTLTYQGSWKNQRTLKIKIKNIFGASYCTKLYFVCNVQ